MDEKEKRARESMAKGGSVPPDARRHSKSRHLPPEFDGHDKREQSERERAQEGFPNVDIERVSEEQKKRIYEEDLST